jgi:hypothetical protein
MYYSLIVTQFTRIFTVHVIITAYTLYTIKRAVKNKFLI